MTIERAQFARAYGPIVEYVCGFYVASDNHVLLLEKVKPEWQKGKLNGVGGKIEPEETVHDAMVREFLEEASRRIPLWEARVTLVIPGKAKVHFHLAQGPRFLKPAPCDEGTFSWVPVDKLTNVIPNLRWVIPLCLDHQICYTVVNESWHQPR